VLVVDVQPPATGANMLLQGTQSLTPSEKGTLVTVAGITQRFITSAVGGATAVEVAAKEKDGKEISFPLLYSKSADLWFGDLTFPDPGAYELTVKAVDGAGRISERSANPVIAHGAGVVKDKKTGIPLAQAKVSVFYYSSIQNDFVLWPGDVYNQANPFITTKNGAFMFVLPPSTYYLTIEKEGYKTFYTSLQKITQHQATVFAVPLAKKPSISFTLPLIKQVSFSLPGIPDFQSADRLEYIAPPSSALASAAEALIGKEAPVFHLPDSKGKDVDIRYLRGKKTILSTWSTWSPLGQAQVSVLDRLQKKHKNDLQVLLLSFQESPGVVETYLRRGGYTLTSIVDQKAELMKSYPILTVPQHFFIDKKGVVRDVLVGFFDEDTLLKKLERL
jgi:peroxiredoxin